MSRLPANSRAGLAQVLGALSLASDVAAGRAPGHALRSCWIGMWLGRALGVRGEELYELYYTLLLKDTGGVLRDGSERGGSAGFGLLGRVTGLVGGRRREDRRICELSRERAARGADVARRLGFGRDVAAGIQALDERWNGRGRPAHRSGRAIPRAAQIALMAQEAALAHADGDRTGAEELVRSRRGTWFDPELVTVFDVVTLNPELWQGLRAADLQERVRAQEPHAFVVSLTDERLDRVAATFGRVLDGGAPFGAGRAARVGELATAIGRELGLSSDRLRWLRRSAQLFDALELGGGDQELFERLDPFRELARAAGQGFPRVAEASESPLELRLTQVAAAYDARTCERGGLAREAALAELEALRGTHLDPNVLDALRRALDERGASRAA